MANNLTNHHINAKSSFKLEIEHDHSIFRRINNPDYVSATRISNIAVIFFVFSIVIGMLIASWQIENKKNDYYQQLIINIAQQAIGKEETLSLWFDNISKIGNSINESDMIRLFFTDINEVGEYNAKRISQSQADVSLSELENIENITDELEPLKLQIPYINSVLTEVTKQHKLDGIWLLDKFYNIYGNNEPELTQNLKKSIALSFKSKKSVISPLKIHNGRITMDIIRPVMDMTNDEVVGIMMVRKNIEQELLKILEIDNFASPKGKIYLLQFNDKIESDSIITNDNAEIIALKEYIKPGKIAEEIASDITEPKQLSYIINNADKIKIDLDNIFANFTKISITNDIESSFHLLYSYNYEKTTSDIKAYVTSEYSKNIAFMLTISGLFFYLAWGIKSRYKSIRIRQQDQIIDAISNIASVKDPSLSDHYEKVARLTLKLAKLFEIDVLERTALYYSSKLLALRLFSVPENILQKDHSLSEAERDELSRHIHQNISYLTQLSIDIPVSHILEDALEKYDGTGFPKGIKGNAINLSARILSAADAYCALRSNRNYRAPLSHLTTIAKLHASGHHDPKVIDAIDKIHKKEQKNK